MYQSKSRFVKCLVRAACGLVALCLVGAGSCTGPSRSGSKKIVETKPALDYAFAQKEEITAGEDLEVKIQYVAPDSSWSIDKIDSLVQGNTITITPRIKKERGQSATAIATPRTETKRIPDLKPGEYTVIVVGSNGKEEFPVKVKPASG